MFGATSVGGLLRYISRDPALEEFRASASADTSVIKGGEWGHTLSGRISVPIIENKLGITVSAYTQKQAGYVDYVDYVDGTGALLEEDYNGGDVDGYAADLLFTPTDELEIRLKYIKQESRAQGLSTVTLADENSDDGIFDSDGYDSPAAPGPISLDFEIYSGTLNYDFGGFTFTSTTSHTKFQNNTVTDLTAAFAGLTDLIAGNPPGTTTSVPFVASSGAEKDVQEFRLTSADSDTFEWIVGGYYTNEKTSNIQDVQTVPAFNLLFASFPSEYTEYAAFGNFTYYISDKFDISGGVRISDNELVLNTLITGALAGAADSISDPIKETVDTYLFAARYRVHDDLSLYARVASGYRPAQPNLPIIDPFSGLDIAPPLVFSDKAWSTEVGAKGKTADGKVDFDISVWRITWANFQASVVANGVSTGGNAADGLTAYGFETSVTARPVDDFSITGNLGYTKSTINSDEPTLGATAGEDHPNLPNWQASVQWSYAFDVTGEWQGSFGGGVRYVGSTTSAFVNAFSVEEVDIDSRTLADLNLTISNGSVQIGLYATNLFDSRALLSRQDLTANDGTGNQVVVDSTAQFERPRTIGANVKIDF